MHITIDIIQSWVQGSVIILILYHLISYYYVKDKSFFLYALYLIVILLLGIENTRNIFSESLSNSHLFLFKDNKMVGFYQCGFIIFYGWFTYYFLDLKKHNKKLARLLILFNNATLIYCTVIFILDTLFFNNKVLEVLNAFILIPSWFFIVYFITLHVLKSKTLLGIFYLIGLYILIIFSIITIYFYFIPISPFLKKHGVRFSHFFMVGTFFEMVILSIGLGIKNLIYKRTYEKNNFKLLKKLQENELLQNKINEKLQHKINQHKKEIYKKTKEVEAYRIAKVEATFKNQVHKLRLSNLLNQMNPHFIFNALNSIKLFIINNDAKNAVYYLNKFSKLIRKILNSSTQNITTLKEELEILKIYINLENIRFSNEIQSTFLIDDELKDLVIPSLILQPFVENAIWHGLSTKKGEKKIQLSFKKDTNNCLEIRIKDNGVGREQAEKNKERRVLKRKSVGLQITKERIKNFAKDKTAKFSLTYLDLQKDNETIGTEVLLKIPLK